MKCLFLCYNSGFLKTCIHTLDILPYFPLSFRSRIHLTLTEGPVKAYCPGVIYTYLGLFVTISELLVEVL